MNKIMLNYY